MARLQLFEFNDQPWLPNLLRDAITGYLDTISRQMRFHEGMRPLVEEALERSGASCIVDLCSGSGGPTLALYEGLRTRASLILTDKYPNRAVFSALSGDRVSARAESVDVCSVPSELAGLRMIMNAFHHLPPDRAQAALRDAAEKGQPLLMIEVTERTAKNLLTSPLIPLFVLLFMPLVRPFRLSYFVWTYLIPIIPLLIWWDGLVSHLRSYSASELEAITGALDVQGYVWEQRRVPLGKGMEGQALLGLPTRTAREA